MAGGLRPRARRRKMARLQQAHIRFRIHAVPAFGTLRAISPSASQERNAEEEIFKMARDLRDAQEAWSGQKISDGLEKFFLFDTAPAFSKFAGSIVRFPGRSNHEESQKTELPLS